MLRELCLEVHVFSVEVYRADFGLVRDDSAKHDIHE